MYQENIYYLPKHETDNRPTHSLYLGLSSAPPTLLSTVLKNVGDYYTEHYHLKQTNKKKTSVTQCIGKELLLLLVFSRIWLSAPFGRNNTMSFSNYHEDHFQNLSDTTQNSLLVFQMYHLIFKWYCKVPLKYFFYLAWHYFQKSFPYNSFLGIQSPSVLHRSE